MNRKYPMSSIFKVIFLIVGWLIVIGVTIAGFANASSSWGGFNLGAFLAFAGAGIVTGGLVIVLSEFITMFMEIERHLDHLSKNIPTLTENPRKSKIGE